MSLNRVRGRGGIKRDIADIIKCFVSKAKMHREYVQCKQNACTHLITNTHTHIPTNTHTHTHSHTL